MREPPLTLGFDDDEDPEREPPRTRGAEPAAATPPPGRAMKGFVVRTDGAARGNPGPASSGAVLIDLARPDARDPRATPDASISDYLGIQTNNVAEYTAVVRAIGLGIELGARRLELLLDSKLIVEQLHGRWRVKDVKLRLLWAEVLRLLRQLPDGWTASHVPRAQNSLADAKCNEAIDRVMAGGPDSVWVRPAN
ncbi:MAG TPA: ribonuclease HI family protein [Candidatus Limnocylindrales bacterium]|nr:ribonuclease HI family protein [Candidatus Limnocylindrales bacterium]